MSIIRTAAFFLVAFPPLYSEFCKMGWYHYEICAALHTAQKMKFSIKDFFSKLDEIRNFRQICLHLLKKFLTENFIFCAVAYNSTFMMSAKFHVVSCIV